MDKIFQKIDLFLTNFEKNIGGLCKSLFYPYQRLLVNKSLIKQMPQTNDEISIITLLNGNWSLKNNYVENIGH